MIRMLLAGYIMGIRSERRLCEEVHLNFAERDDNFVAIGLVPVDLHQTCRNLTCHLINILEIPQINQLPDS
jgi:transposase